MRKIIKKICLPLLVMFLVCFIGTPVFAAGDLPDLDRLGSIAVTIKNTDTDDTVSGGSFGLYRVAGAVEDGGDFAFCFTETFSGCGLSLKNIQSEMLASDLAAYAERNGISKTVQNAGKDGKVIFKGIKTGLYLVVQQSAAEGYNRVKPFLVSIPLQEVNDWIYDVDASPKAELTKIHPQSPTQPQSPGISNSTPVGTILPQTGQLNWPVPVLAIAGLLLFALGWGLNNTKRKTDYVRE